MTELGVALCGLAILLWLVTRYLRGPDLQIFDRPVAGRPAPTRQQFSSGQALNDEHRAVIATLGRLTALLKGAPRSQHLRLIRSYWEDMTADQAQEATFIPVDAGGVPAEWVLAPGADSNRRTLYIHGGGWTWGSSRSYRAITAKFSEITGGAVLAIDYRLMPEHTRLAGIEDCRSAYRWMLDHGSEGATPASTVFVAGDSAGGNLTLALIAWIRDKGLRAPDAAIAFSPATDATFGSPSYRSNIATDAMLGPLIGGLISQTPRWLLLWTMCLQHRMRPCDPVDSPVFGDLSGLPPLLIHASDCEMLLDDSVRYANKAAAAGTSVTLQTWQHVVHVWHLFHPNLTEARQGFEEIRKFLALRGLATSSK